MSAHRTPQYVSPATQALAVTITGPTSLSEGINLTTSNPNCQASLYSNLVCTVSLALAPCSSSAACYTGTFATYDAAYTNTVSGSCTPLSSCTQPVGAKVLSQAQSVSFPVAAGAANNVPIVLGGVPTALRIVPDSSSIDGNALSGFLTLATGQNGQVSVFGVDADGNYILGSGAPSVSLTTSDATQFTVSALGASAPNRFTITNVSRYPTIAMLTATGTPTAASGAMPITTNVGIATQQPILYVANAFNNTVTAYDSQGEQQSLSGTFPNLKQPAGIAYDPANGFLYVLNLGPNTVTAYNLQGVQQSLSGTFPNNVPEAGIAYDPANGFLYVVYANDSITAYDSQGVQQSLSGTFPNLNGPINIAYDPANGFLYVTNAGNNTVTAYNAQGAQQPLSGTFPNLNQPAGIAYYPANGFLYVANFSKSTVTAYNLQGVQQSLSGTFPNLNGPRNIAYDPANGFLYVVNPGVDSITAYDSQGAQQSLSGTFPNIFNPGAFVIVP